MPGTVSIVRYQCGPLTIELVGRESPELERARLTLAIYSAAWHDCPLHYRVKLVLNAAFCGMSAGTWLRTGRMHVDAVATGMRATCLSGSHVSFDRASGGWQVSLPSGPVDIWRLTDVEHMLSLVLTTGWRDLGWVPLHAGAVTRDGACAVLCAPSGGGKTTFTTSLLRRGWGSLGDDKLLLRCLDGAPPELRALVHSLNLFPHSVRWFPELDRIEELPAYSVWTDKRRVPMESVREGSALAAARPTHVVRVTRRDGEKGVRVGRLSGSEILDLLMRQTVIPADRFLARTIVGAVGRTAALAKGLAVEIGDDAYDDARHLEAFEEAVLG